MSEKLFTVEAIPDEEKVEIHLDDNGLSLLIEELELLRKSKENEHLHFFTNKFGGDELTDEKQNQGSNAIFINHLKIFLWKE